MEISTPNNQIELKIKPNQNNTKILVLYYENGVLNKKESKAFDNKMKAYRYAMSIRSHLQNNGENAFISESVSLNLTEDRDLTKTINNFIINISEENYSDANKNLDMMVMKMLENKLRRVNGEMVTEGVFDDINYATTSAMRKVKNLPKSAIASAVGAFDKEEGQKLKTGLRNKEEVERQRKVFKNIQSIFNRIYKISNKNKDTDLINAVSNTSHKLADYQEKLQKENVNEDVFDNVGSKLKGIGKAFTNIPRGVTAKAAGKAFNKDLENKLTSGMERGYQAEVQNLVKAVLKNFDYLISKDPENKAELQKLKDLTAVKFDMKKDKSTSTPPPLPDDNKSISKPLQSQAKMKSRQGLKDTLGDKMKNAIKNKQKSKLINNN